MGLKDRAKNLIKEAARDISRNVISHTIHRVSNAIVSKVPNPKPKGNSGDVPNNVFKLMLARLADYDDQHVSEHITGAAKHLLARNPPEYLCYDFLATLEDYSDEDVNALVKSAFNVKAMFPRPPQPKKK